MSKRLRVLIVDGSDDDTQLLLRELAHGGYELEFERVDDAETMASSLSRRTWDIVLSEYAMPEFSGLAALSILKHSGLDLPFILLTGTGGESGGGEAMKAGGHDFEA